MSTVSERLFEGPLREWLTNISIPLAGRLGRGTAGTPSADESSAPESVLRLQRLPRSAWPIVVATIARAASERGRSVLVLVPGPARFLGELRRWLAGRPSSYQFHPDSRPVVGVKPG